MWPWSEVGHIWGIYALTILNFNFNVWFLLIRFHAVQSRVSWYLQSIVYVHSYMCGGVWQEFWKRRKDHPDTHFPFFEFAANRQREFLLCLIQNHIDLCCFQFTSPSQHTHTHTCMHNSLILPHRLRSWKTAFRQFTDARHTLKIIRSEYYLKTRTDPACRNEALQQCWAERGDTGLKNDTVWWAISFSGSKRNIWLVWAPKSTNEAKETV